MIRITNWLPVLIVINVSGNRGILEIMIMDAVKEPKRYPNSPICLKQYITYLKKKHSDLTISPQFAGLCGLHQCSCTGFFPGLSKKDT